MCVCVKKIMTQFNKLSLDKLISLTLIIIMPYVYSVVYLIPAAQARYRHRCVFGLL